MDNTKNVQLSIEELNEIMNRLIADENAENRDVELICGMALLAEGYADRNEYDNVREQAQTALEVIDKFNAPEDLKLQVLKRIIRALEPTPFHHLLRNLLAAYVLKANHADLNPSDYREEAEKLVKIDILLEPDAYKPDESELDHILATMFTSAELINMIRSPHIGFLVVDRVEYTWEWESIALEVDKRVEEMLKDVPKGMGFCFHYWSTKEDLLKKEYGIQWHSPAVMNPRVMFD